MISLAALAAFNAGHAIMEIYKEKDFGVEYKSDLSPLTRADKESHKIIAANLENTGLALISEEGRKERYEERVTWDHAWIVDPLDGTREFIKRNGEFTVNIGLLESQTPVAGIVYAPAVRRFYFAVTGQGAFMLNNQFLSCAAKKKNMDWKEMVRNSKPLPVHPKPGVYTIVASRSHINEKTRAFIEDKEKETGRISLSSRGSALKLCLVAEGAANIYPRFGPTMEWDTAAGHAIASESGCDVYQPGTREKLKYNKKEFLNPPFIVERESW